MSHNLDSFVKQVLIKEIKLIQQKHGHHYLSFSLISQGIEFLGACLDNKFFHINSKKEKDDSERKLSDNDRKISQRRFQNAIKRLFPTKYKGYAEKGNEYNLYENLRCGLLHVLLPKNKLELIQYSEAKKYKLKHLEKVNIRGSERLVLVSEVLFEDFEKACEKLLEMNEKNQLKGNQINDILLETDLE